MKFRARCGFRNVETRDLVLLTGFLSLCRNQNQDKDQQDAGDNCDADCAVTADFLLLLEHNGRRRGSAHDWSSGCFDTGIVIAGRTAAG